MGNLIDFDPLVSPLQVWLDGTYIYVTAGTTLYAYSFDGSNLNQITSIATEGMAAVNGIWGDGTYIYTHSATFAYLRAFTFDGVSFTQVFSHMYPGSGYNPSFGYSIRGDGTYLYRSVEGSGGKRLVAYQWVGGVLTAITDTAIGYTASRLICQGGAIFVAQYSNSISKYTYNGISFSLVGQIIDSNIGTPDGDGTYIFTPYSGTSIRVYENNLSTVTTFSEGLTSINGINCWNNNVLVCANDEIRGYTFDGSSFTFVDNAENVGSPANQARNAALST